MAAEIVRTLITLALYPDDLIFLFRFSPEEGGLDLLNQLVAEVLAGEGDALCDNPQRLFSLYVDYPDARVADLAEEWARRTRGNPFPHAAVQSARRAELQPLAAWGAAARLAQPLSRPDP